MKVENLTPKSIHRKGSAIENTCDKIDISKVNFGTTEKMLQKEKILSEKVKVWDNFFKIDQEIIKSGPKVQNGPLSTEKVVGLKTEIKTKPNMKKEAETSKILRGVNSVRPKRAEKRDKHVFCTAVDQKFINRG